MADDAITLLLATNRSKNAKPGSWKGPSFGDTVASVPGSPQNLSCATATVTGTAIDNADSGVIAEIGAVSEGWFSQAQLQPLLASPRDILVFVHGTDNSFADAVKRAAYNRKWLADLGRAAQANASAEFDVILFTWPSCAYGAGSALGEFDFLSDYEDYLNDQKQAAQSAYHFALFLRKLAVLGGRIGARRRMNLLCHSMGNYMAADAIELMSHQGELPQIPVFDQIVLAAPDEQASTFAQPSGGRMSNLWKLGREITTYFNNNDVLMKASHCVNAKEGFRLGYDGPPNEADTHFFSRNAYDFVDCTGINDSISRGLLDTHQYYRESPTMRTDIVACLLGLAPKRLTYDPKENRFTLFPQTPPAPDHLYV